jgi:MFS family permease
MSVDPVLPATSSSPDAGPPLAPLDVSPPLAPLDGSPPLAPLDVSPPLAPLDGSPPRAPLDAGPPPQAPLDAALARLVARGVLTSGQAEAVLAEVPTSSPDAAPPDAAPPDAAPPDAAAPDAARPTAVTSGGAPAAARPGARARLVEVAAYLGAVLVAASVVAFLADSWDDLSEVSRLALLVGAGLVAYAAGAVVATTVAGGFRALREHAHAARRRVSSALMALGAVLLGFGAAQVLDGAVDRTEIVGTAVVLALLVVAQLLAPCAITEVGMLCSTLLLVGQVADLVIPEPEPGSYAEEYQPPPDATLVPAALAVVGLLWAAVVSRLLTLPVLATALGCAAALIASLQVALLPDKRVGLAMLAVLALVGLVLFLRVHLWPWLALTVGAVTLFVFVVVSEQAAPALAFLVAGLVLLAGALGAALLGRRTARLADQPEEPAPTA